MKPALYNPIDHILMALQGLILVILVLFFSIDCLPPPLLCDIDIVFVLFYRPIFQPSTNIS